jgi:hypothetical protein
METLSVNEVVYKLNYDVCEVEDGDYELPVVIEVDGKQYNFEITRGYRKIIFQITEETSL